VDDEYAVEILEALFDLKRDVRYVIAVLGRTMSPEKKARIRKQVEEWARTDPAMRRLRERIEYYRARAESRRESS
jgi:dissimilatory sulfite reductase (desulfoviridin) alpha/beta subunit